MSLDYYQRREYRQNDFVYLLDDEEKTAWIKKGRIKRCRRYRLPDHVTVDGERYTVESVEIGAYNYPHSLQHLVIPDTFVYVDEDTLYGLDNLRSVYIGEKVEELNNWNFRLCPKLRNFVIAKDNPYMAVRDRMIVSKDGKRIFSKISEHTHLIIPEGVEEINDVAFWYSNRLESISFPSTLRKIGDNSFSNCPKLRRVVLPEGFEECIVQCFMENESLELIDFPVTLTRLGWMTFAHCPNLKTIILRMPTIPEDTDFLDIQDVPVETCRLYVPASLLEQYRQHPVWGEFRNIVPIKS